MSKILVVNELGEQREISKGILISSQIEDDELKADVVFTEDISSKSDITDIFIAMLGLIDQINDLDTLYWFYKNKFQS